MSQFVSKNIHVSDTGNCLLALREDRVREQSGFLCEIQLSAFPIKLRCTAFKKLVEIVLNGEVAR